MGCVVMVRVLVVMLSELGKMLSAVKLVVEIDTF